MQQSAQQFISIEAYLDGEQHSEIRHEYFDGQVHAMAGAGENHNLIALNVASALRSAARGTPCRAFIADMKLYLAEFNRFYYPDVMLACDPDDNHQFYKERPCLLVEVLSDSTETIDRREKLHAYQSISGLKEYVLIAQDKPQIELYRRSGDHWQYILLDEADDALRLECLSLELSMAMVFEDVFNFG